MVIVRNVMYKLFYKKTANVLTSTQISSIWFTMMLSNRFRKRNRKIIRFTWIYGFVIALTYASLPVSQLYTHSVCYCHDNHSLTTLAFVIYSFVIIILSKQYQNQTISTYNNEHYRFQVKFI